MCCPLRVGKHFNECMNRLCEQNPALESKRQHTEDNIRRWKRWVVSGARIAALGDGASMPQGRGLLIHPAT